MVSSMLRERDEMLKYKKREDIDITSEEYAASLVYSADALYQSLGYKT